MTFQKMLVWINCVLFVVFGFGFLLAPEVLAEFVTSTSPSTASAVTDMRATYGGMALGLGLIFGLSARDLQTLSLGVWGVFFGHDVPRWRALARNPLRRISELAYVPVACRRGSYGNPRNLGITFG